MLAGVGGLLLLSVAIARSSVLPQWSRVVLPAAFLGFTVVGDAEFGFAFAGGVWLAVGYLLSAKPAVIPAPA